MRKAIALFGVLGLVGCFLPLVGGISMFDLRHLDALPVWLLVAAFATPVVAGLADDTRTAAIAAPPKGRTMMIVNAFGFGYVLFKFGTGTIDLVLDAGIGGKMMGVAAIAGFTSSLLGFAEKRTR